MMYHISVEIITDVPGAVLLFRINYIRNHFLCFYLQKWFLASSKAVVEIKYPAG